MVVGGMGGEGHRHSSSRPLHGSGGNCKRVRYDCIVSHAHARAKRRGHAGSIMAFFKSLITEFGNGSEGELGTGHPGKRGKQVRPPDGIEDRAFDDVPLCQVAFHGIEIAPRPSWKARTETVTDREAIIGI